MTRLQTAARGYELPPLESTGGRLGEPLVWCTRVTVESRTSAAPSGSVLLPNFERISKVVQKLNLRTAFVSFSGCNCLRFESPQQNVRKHTKPLNPKGSRPGDYTKASSSNGQIQQPAHRAGDPKNESGRVDQTNLISIANHI